MKTFDGYDLKEGDDCIVLVNDEAGYCSEKMRAIYRSELAIGMGWDFEIPELKSDQKVEVVAVWKTTPATPKTGTLDHSETF